MSAGQHHSSLPLRELAPSWYRSLRTKNRSPRTIAAYRPAVDQLTANLQEHDDPHEVDAVTADAIRGYGCRLGVGVVCHGRSNQCGLTTTCNQTIILVMSKTLPLSEVKARFSQVVDEIVATQERITVTRNGRPVAVVVGADDFEAMEETLAILSDPAAMREIERGRTAVANGDVVTKDEIEALRNRLRADPA